MRRYAKTPLAQYTLIACLGLSLVLAQALRLHMHFEHVEGTASSIEHRADVHLAASSHDNQFDTQHHDESQNHHGEIDFSFADVLKKAEWSKLTLVLFLVAVLILYQASPQRLRRQFTFILKLDSLYYLLQPPLRAPPL